MVSVELGQQFTYLEVFPTRSKSPDHNVCPLHASVWAQTKAHPACCVDSELEYDGPVLIIKAPLKAD